MYSWVTVPRPDRRVPHERDLAEEAARVEVEVGLGVGGDDARPHRQEGDVGQGGQRRAAPPIHHAAAARSRPAGRSGGGVPPPGGGDGGGRGHEEGPRRSPGSVSRQRRPGVSPRLGAPVATSTEEPPDRRAAPAGGDPRLPAGAARGRLPGRPRADRRRGASSTWGAARDSSRRGSSAPGREVVGVDYSRRRGGDRGRPLRARRACGWPRWTRSASAFAAGELRRRLLVAPHRALHRPRAATSPSWPGCSRTTASPSSSPPTSRPTSRTPSTSTCSTATSSGPCSSATSTTCGSAGSTPRPT